MKFPFTKQSRTGLFDRFGGIDWDSMAAYLDGWKDGQMGDLRLNKRFLPKTNQQLGYYYAVILDRAFKAFLDSGNDTIIITVLDRQATVPLTRETLDVFLKTRWAEGTNNPYKGKAEMTIDECSEFETYIINWLAKWLNCQIPPADKNWRDKPRPERTD